MRVLWDIKCLATPPSTKLSECMRVEELQHWIIPVYQNTQYLRALQIRSDPWPNKKLLIKGFLEICWHVLYYWKGQSFTFFYFLPSTSLYLYLYIFIWHILFWRQKHFICFIISFIKEYFSLQMNQRVFVKVSLHTLRLCLGPNHWLKGSLNVGFYKRKIYPLL